MGYYFRKSSVNYSNLFSNWYLSGSGDYTSRWQKPGDEKFTNVPSLTYPANSSRDMFYSNAEALIEKADNIRLEDIKIEYLFEKEKWSILPFKQARVYLYLNNIGKIWVANKEGIDPYYSNSPRIGKSVSLGLNFSL